MAGKQTATGVADAASEPQMRPGKADAASLSQPAGEKEARSLRCGKRAVFCSTVVLGPHSFTV